MAATDEMVKIACEVLPDLVTLVPENRTELTTEGGLNIASFRSKLKGAVSTLHEKDIKVSVFIDPEPQHVDDAIEIGADIIEIHTGKFANAVDEHEQIKELSKIGSIARMATEMGLVVVAGHGLNYNNIFPFLNIKEVREVSIGHSIISRAVFIGLQKAVEDMIRILEKD
jgi:pyridoxine 5-phosphate synthase